MQSAAREESASSSSRRVIAPREVAAQRVGVVRRRVDDLPLAMVLEPVRVRLRPAERPEQDDHPGEAELVAQRLDVRGDHAEVLGDHGQRAELPLCGAEHRVAGAGQPAPSRASVDASGIAQKAAKPRKWSIRVRSKSSKVRRSRSIHQR